MGRGKRRTSGTSLAESGMLARADDHITLSDSPRSRRTLPPNLIKSFSSHPLPRPVDPVSAPASAASGPNALLGKTYVITGKIPGFTRDQAIAALADMGASVYDDAKYIRPGLTALIEGGLPASKKAKGGTKKQQAAMNAGVPVLDEHDFYQLIGRQHP